MKIKEGLEEKYKEYVGKNTDPYGGGVIKYSEKWADLMEAEIEKGKKIKDIAKKLSFHPTLSELGITGFMYGCAVQGLSIYWIHGEELRLWHNLDTQFHNEGVEANKSGGVLNPALISMEKKD